MDTTGLCHTKWKVVAVLIKFHFSRYRGPNNFSATEGRIVHKLLLQSNFIPAFGVCAVLRNDASPATVLQVLPFRSASPCSKQTYSAVSNRARNNIKSKSDPVFFIFYFFEAKFEITHSKKVLPLHLCCSRFFLPKCSVLFIPNQGI